MRLKLLLPERQMELLELAHALGGKDESLAAKLHELGYEVDRTSIVRWRRGEYSAPIGLLFALLSHLGQDGRRRLIESLARPFGLRVVEDDLPSAGDLRDECMDVASAAGDLNAEVRRALADDALDDIERAAIRERLQSARRELDEAESSLDQAPRFARSRR